VGGAGYIGSHMVKFLFHQGCEVVVLDDLSSGNADISRYASLTIGNVSDKEVLGKVLPGVCAVMHFASSIEVSESIRNPAKYYLNNLSNTLTLLDSMCEHSVSNFIFSSTAATFGEPITLPIDENHSQVPINPYGKSKLMVEQILEDYDRAYGLTSVCLRYFNAAGADPAGEFGECHEPETHLIPLVLKAALGLRESINIYGRDYVTPDGTCIRDYVHVMDLCSAHWLALTSLLKGSGSQRYNLGNGHGFSVKEVIEAAIDVTGRTIKVVDAPRRAGDPAVLVADSAKAKVELGWVPRYHDLKTIIEHAWKWELSGNRPR